ncbi:MAG: protein translocase subunit SecD [Candidatus Aquirickettsiella gammari]|uniref:Protein translocase subunit SecD n=1 Tax=Candidatus Aquirickettsiella gammari TaxID=2016198 RepID=A0A370CFN1_9COXI|nr:MAG: protein translocase subunit SecD [Candidatus Aquirickettsiella gammari]
MLNKYPLWKNVLLLVLILLGFVYAAPNLFPEQPAVQISPTTAMANVDMDTLQTKVNTLIKAVPIHPISEEFAKQTILLRFNNTDTQLRVKDILSAELGDDYTVAVNLLSSTPRWMQAIGALPMKLGLDLRGGVHFALEVDIDNLIVQRMQGLTKSIAKNLQQANIRYTELIPKEKQLDILFRDTMSLDQAKALLQRQFPAFEFTTSIAATHRNQLTAQWTRQGLNSLRQLAIEQTVNTLRNRINELGVAEPIVQQQGSNRILVDLPGVQDIARAQQILGGTATIEFRLVDITHDPHTAQLGKLPPGAQLYQYQNQPVLLNKQVILAGSSITDAATSFDESGRSAVSISLGGGGEAYFHQVTGENIGKPLAIVYVETKSRAKLVNGKITHIPHKVERVISIANIQTALPPNFQVTGLSDTQEALNLSLLLRAGALPAPIYVVEQRTIGPQLGAENIHKGIISIVVGFVLAVVFMAIYYGVFGVIADIALALNLVLLIALLSLLGMTLTLPGMAGIVLTVGMAVDANVLIFERIREELRNGVSPQASIHAGYDRALITIIDANVTTLIVALILFGVGTGSIKGFAVTLTIGLLTSMLTGIMVTRALINACYGGRPLKRLPIGI